MVIYTAFDSITKKKGAPILYSGSHRSGMFDTDLRLKEVKQTVRSQFYNCHGLADTNIF